MAEEQIREIVERRYQEEFEKRKISPDLLAKVIASSTRDYILKIVGIVIAKIPIL